MALGQFCTIQPQFQQSANARVTGWITDLQLHVVWAVFLLRVQLMFPLRVLLFLSLSLRQMLTRVVRPVRFAHFKTMLLLVGLFPFSQTSHTDSRSGCS